MNIEESIVKLILPDGGIQTAWFVNDSGIMLSAGHGFANLSKENLMKEIYFEFASNPLRISASLIDHRYDLNEGTDYAILKAGFKEPLKFSFLPIKKFQSVDTGKQTTLYGYASVVGPKALMPYQGELGGTKTTGSKSGYWILNTLDINGDVAGTSGGPVIVSDKVIGIQSRQVTGQKHFCLLTPIEKITHPSVGQILNGQQILPKYLRQLTNTNAYKSYYAKRPVTSNNRFIVSIQSTEEENLAIYNEIHDLDNWKAYVIAPVKRAIKNLVPIKNSDIDSIFELRQYQTSLVPSFKHIDEYINEITTKFHIDRFKEHVRIYIDFDGNGVEHKAVAPPIASEQFPSHIVGIALSAEQTDLKVVQSSSAGIHFCIGQLLDNFINANEVNRSNLLRRIWNIIIDVYLDLLVFHSIPVIFSLFNNGLAGRSFSQSKVLYASKKKFNVYGKTIEPFLDYISFASCARMTIDSEIDFKRLNNIWIDFINNSDGLFAGFLMEEASNDIQLNENIVAFKKTLLNYIISHKTIGKQISKRKLSDRIDAFFSKIESSPRNSIFIFAILVKKPGKSIVSGVEAMFGYSKYKINMFNFFQISDLPALLKYSHVINMFFFKW